MRSLAVLVTTSLLSLSAGEAQAEQRALLVGVGKYNNPRHDLPAIGLDLAMMHDSLLRMGFDDSQIHTLQDEKATSKNVIKEFKTWLRDGVETDDRVIFYFSGHGSNVPDFNNDEGDGVDEVLVTHDVRFTRRRGKPTLAGVVDDDTIFKLISAIPSRNVLTIVDACHSGTATRGFPMANERFGKVEYYDKSYTYDDMPDGQEEPFGKDIADTDDLNFLSISAAGDGEKAIGTTKGGVFTIALTNAIRDAAQNNQSLTINQIRDLATVYISEHVDEGRAHHPQISGNSSLAAKPLLGNAPAPAVGPNRKKLMDMVEEHDGRFDLTSNAEVYKLEQPVELTMNIPMDGYLNVVSIDASDASTVLFPNAFHDDNRVTAGSFHFPTTKMAFKLPATEPVGPTLVVAFVTHENINFFDESLDERDKDGNMNVGLATMSQTATRAIRVAPKEQGKYAALLEIEVIR